MATLGAYCHRQPQGVFAGYLSRRTAQISEEYLNEFCYRFNRRDWEAELPLRLLDACLTHTQVKLKMV